MEAPTAPTVVMNSGVVMGKSEPATKSEKDSWPSEVEKVPIAAWDSGVFVTELINLSMVPKKIELSTREREALNANPESLLGKAESVKPPRIEEGTFRGSQLAITKIYEIIEANFTSFMNTANFEPTIPTPQPLEKKKQLFSFTRPDPKADNFPPHLNLAANKPAADVAPDVHKSTLSTGDLFNKMRLAQLTYLLPALMPKKFIERVAVKAARALGDVGFGEMGRPDRGDSFSDVERYNRQERSQTGFFARNDIFNLPNVGDLDDWYSDERFAQQHFTGTNPATIERASDFWVSHFIDSATPEDRKMQEKIRRLASESTDSLYMQDYSYFRKAAGVNESDVISCTFKEVDQETGETRTSRRYGVAAVCLFHLAEDGKLNPLAIVCDWRGSAKNSVTVYNKELNTSDQREDWPWRYAKTCVQTSDWLRHEVTVHLTNTHLVEEATIVAAQRCFEDGHPVFQLLYPHWQKTLALNAAARITLIPHVIIPLIGFEDSAATQFILSEYYKYDFEGSYVPKDLKSRGFDPAQLDSRKFRNYAYARCIHSMWFKIREFVSTMLALHYKGPEADRKVAGDEHVRAWCETMQRDPSGKDGGAGIKSFPTIKTFEGLVDAVTMCIHIASPQHTAVNYLQNYYQSFVVNKPPCLYRPPPESRAELMAYTEADLVKALPMNHPHEWLLASHIPYLLSFKPGDRESLIMYAASKYHVYKEKGRDKYPDGPEIKAAAARFYKALADSEEEFAKYGDDTFDASVIRYDVLSPDWNAVSILI